MYFGSDTPETVSLIGTPAFIEFVEGIQREGVDLDRVPMGGGTRRADSLVVEVETDNPEKDLDALDIALPRLARRYLRRYDRLDELDARTLSAAALPLKTFPVEETRGIVFKTLLDGDAHHTVQLDAGDGRSVVAFSPASC